MDRGLRCSGPKVHGLQSTATSKVAKIGVWPRNQICNQNRTDYDTLVMVNLMANMTVKDIPDEVYKEVRELAASQGRSLNRYVIDLLEEKAQDGARRRRMRLSREAFRKFRDSLPFMGDSTELIREDRER